MDDLLEHLDGNLGSLQPLHVHDLGDVSAAPVAPEPVAPVPERPTLRLAVEADRDAQAWIDDDLREGDDGVPTNLRRGAPLLGTCAGCVHFNATPGLATGGCERFGGFTVSEVEVCDHHQGAPRAQLAEPPTPAAPALREATDSPIFEAGMTASQIAERVLQEVGRDGGNVKPRRAAAKPKPKIYEDDPRFNWRTQGNGRRGVVAADGRRIIVDAATYDRMARRSQLSPATKQMTGDGPAGEELARQRASAKAQAAGAHDTVKRGGSSSSGQRPTQDNNPEFNAKHARAGGKFASKPGGSQGSAPTQQQLVNRGIKKRLGIDHGATGAQTAAAVRAYQKKNGLKVDGVVGKQTSSALLGNKGAAKVTVGKMKTGQAHRLSQG